MNRVSVIGTSGSGKTTFARDLARQLGYRHVELDTLHWEPDWVEAPDEIFRQRVEDFIHEEQWVVDGNYSVTRDLVWGRADTVVWLDYGYLLVMARVIRRTVTRVATREELFAGNRESFRASFLSRDSIILWALTTYHRRKREYPQLFAQPEYAHLRVIRLKSPQQAKRWIASLASPDG